MPEVQKLPAICEDDCEGERGKRGKRGHRGHDGLDGATGPTGPTGPAAEILHVQARQENTPVPLPPNTQTTVLVTPPLVAPAGYTIEFTGIVQYVNRGNSNNYAQPNVVLLVDGLLQTLYAEIPGAFPTDGTFLLTAILPLTAWLFSDGLPHVYGLAIQTDSVSDGEQIAVKASIFVNAIP